MTSTVVRDSIVGDAWIQQTAAACPVQRVIDPKTGQPNGDILTGPVRIAFDNLFTLPQAKQGQSEPKYGCAILFTPYADFSILYEEYYKLCGQNFPEYYDAQSGQYHGLQSPFHDQAEKARFGGFTPGLVYMNVTSKYKPPIVDSRGNPIVDPSKVYPGVWAICSLNPYPYGKNPPQPKKGAAFGLQSIMLIGDDTRFGGGQPDTQATFKGVNVQAPITRPNIGSMPQGGAPTPAAGIPGYTAPGGGLPQPGMPQQPAHIPQQHYTPPVQQQGFTPPGAPASSAGAMPGATTYAPPATTSPTSGDDDLSFLYQ